MCERPAGSEKKTGFDSSAGNTDQTTRHRGGCLDRGIRIAFHPADADLRRENYGDAELAAWAERIRGQGWSEAYVFFKHEDDGTAPKFARRLMEIAGA